MIITPLSSKSGVSTVRRGRDEQIQTMHMAWCSRALPQTVWVLEAHLQKINSNGGGNKITSDVRHKLE